jgi:hypothetical protein
VLEQNFDKLNQRGSTAKGLEQIVSKKQTEASAKDGISQKEWRKALSRFTRFMASTKDGITALGKGLGLISQFDPHGIAPIAIGGIFAVVQVVQNYSDENLMAITMVLDITEDMAL